MGMCRVESRYEIDCEMLGIYNQASVHLDTVINTKTKTNTEHPQTMGGT